MAGDDDYESSPELAEQERKREERRRRCRALFETPEGRWVLKDMLREYGSMEVRTMIVGNRADPYYAAYRDGRASVPIKILEFMKDPEDIVIETITETDDGY